MLRQQNTEGRKRALIPEVVIGCLYLDPTLTASGEGTKLHRGFGIHRQTQDSLCLVGFTVDLAKLVKNSVRFRDFLQRFVFLPFAAGNPAY